MPTCTRCQFSTSAVKMWSTLRTGPCKVKYGGPFTTKQVEDVKFARILKLLLSIGPVFFFNKYCHSTLFSPLWGHLSLSCNENGVNTSVKSILLYFGSTSPLHTVVSISLYTCPVCHGLGIALLVAPLLCSVTNTTVICWDTKMASVACLAWSKITPMKLSLMIIHALIFNAVYILYPIYIVLYEFICSQSPHSIHLVFISHQNEVLYDLSDK